MPTENQTPTDLDQNCQEVCQEWNNWQNRLSTEITGDPNTTGVILVSFDKDGKNCGVQHVETDAPNAVFVTMLGRLKSKPIVEGDLDKPESVKTFSGSVTTIPGGISEVDANRIQAMVSPAILHHREVRESEIDILVAEGKQTPEEYEEEAKKFLDEVPGAKQVRLGDVAPFETKEERKQRKVRRSSKTNDEFMAEYVVALAGEVEKYKATNGEDGYTVESTDLVYRDGNGTIVGIVPLKGNFAPEQLVLQPEESDLLRPIETKAAELGAGVVRARPPVVISMDSLTEKEKLEVESAVRALDAVGPGEGRLPINQAITSRGRGNKSAQTIAEDEWLWSEANKNFAKAWQNSIVEKQILAEQVAARIKEEQEVIKKEKEAEICLALEADRKNRHWKTRLLRLIKPLSQFVQTSWLGAKTAVFQVYQYVNIRK